MPNTNEPLDPDVAFFIDLHTTCATYHVLPATGGWFDQDSYIVWGLQSVINALAEKEANRQGEAHKRMNTALKTGKVPGA